MKTITVDAVWAWTIATGIKTVENRTWHVNYRGPIAIHAGRNTKREADALAFLKRLRITPPDGAALDKLRGSIACVCQLKEIMKYKDHLNTVVRAAVRDPFASGPYCWMLEDATPLEYPIYARGQQGLWECSYL